MNKLNIFLFLALLLIFSNPASAQTAVKSVNNGRYKPSSNAQGEYLRVFFVFAKFKSDNADVKNWPRNEIPSWAKNLIDTNVSSNYRTHTISDYFKVMSQGRYDVIGNVYDQLIEIPFDTSYSEANKYVLEELNRNIPDFKIYDNWKREKDNYVFSHQSGDGYLDLIHIIYRWADKSWFKLNSGIANLGFQQDFVTHDSIRISGRQTDFRGSGLTTNSKAVPTDNFAFTQHFVHEFGHYLFGGGHTSEGGIMQGEPYGYDGITYAMNAWEREYLGYISIPETQDGETITLKDYVTTGDAVKINSGKDEYLIIENHQRKSSYDQVMRGGELNGNWAPQSKLGAGIYVYYIKNAQRYPPTSFILGADGGWEWEFAGNMKMPQGWPEHLPLISKGKSYRYLPDKPANQKGKSDRNPWLYVDGLKDYKNYRWHSIDPVTKEWVLSRNVMGDETDAFNIGYNEIISPWSNPSTTKLINQKEVLTNISIQLLSQNAEGDITIKIFKTYEGSLSLPPAKPQNLRTILNDDTVKLTWEANREPDIISYKIYRAFSVSDVPENYKNISTVASAGTNSGEWIDNDIPAQTGKLFYKISAVDESGQESVFSDFDWIKIDE